MPISPTWEDTVEDSPSWDDTVEEKAEAPKQGFALPEGLGEQLRKQDQFQQNLRAYTGGSPMSPGGMDSDFTKSLFVDAPVAAGGAIGRGIHALMTPIEKYASTLAMAQAPDTFAVDPGRVPLAAEPGKSIVSGLEPPPEARGAIPSIRRTVAGMTTPGGIILAPLAGARPIQAAFALGAASGIPGSVQELAQATTPAERRGALTDIGIGALFAGTMGREALRPRASRATAPRAQQPEVVPQAKAEVVPEVSPEARVGDQDLTVIVQSPQALGAETMPGYVQIDSVRGGKNEWSSNPTKLIEEGYDIPTTEQFQSLPQGKYTMPQAKQMLKEKGAPIKKSKEEIATGFTPAQLQSAIAGEPMGFFPRQSEALGLGEPSMPPNIESVRAQRLAESRPPQETPSTTTFPTEGENVKMRKSAERATTSPDIPEPVQEVIKTAPESFYRQQSMKRVEETVSEMSEGDLAAVPRDSNLYTAARLEQAGRLFKEGKNDAGYEVFVELEKEGTRLGQLINQFKLLKGTRPEEVVRVIDKTLEKAGKDSLNPKQREEAIKKSEQSKTADTQLDAATEEWAKNPTPENAAKAEKSLLDAHEAGMELQRFVSKYQPRSTPAILKSILQGNLLTPISQARNIVGNMSFSPLRAGTRAAATGFDVLNNYLTKSPRTMTVQPIRGTAEVVKGFGRGVKQIPDIFLRGTGDTIKGETRAGLHPIKAWINQFAKNPEMPTTGGKITLQDRLNLAIEGTFGVPAEAMLRGLGAGDVPFREAARARATATELSLANVPKDQWSFAQKFPELFLNDTALARIQSETLRAVFQQPSKTLNLVTNWIRGKGDWFDLAVATVAPYKLTPWNIIGEILSYNPLIAAARSVHSSKLKNPREARLNAGKFVVGSMLTAAGWWLYKSGLMSPSLDQRDESQKARVLSGEVMPPNHINLSGLKRAMNGGDPAFKAGDETADVFSAGGLAGSMFYMTANIGRDFERKPEVADSEIWGAILRQSTLEQARFGMNQSFLSGVEGLLSAVREGNTDNYVRQWGNTVASIPLPNSLTVMSRASREYKPDFREDTFRKQMENVVRNKLGVANMDDYLPLKRGLWGEPMLETPEGRNAIMYHFFDVFKNKQVTSDPVPLELFRLWRKTGDTRVIPSLPDEVMTVNRQTYPLNAEQQSRYAELVGQSRRQIVDAVVVNPQFHKLSDEDKITLLDRVYRKGQEAGKAQFWQENGSKLTPKPARAGFTPPE